MWTEPMRGPAIQEVVTRQANTYLINKQNAREGYYPAIVQKKLTDAPTWLFSTSGALLRQAEWDQAERNEEGGK
jgi:hypothetical protein